MAIYRQDILNSMKSALFLVLLFASAVYAAPSLPMLQCSKVNELQKAKASAMRLPSDVAVDSQGRIYVVDSGNQRILVYSSTGKFLFLFGSDGNGPGELHFPVGIGLSKDGRVLVADRGNNRIQIFNRDGEFIKSIEIKDKKNGSFTPVDVAVDQREKRIYVTVSAPVHQILVLDNEGKILSRIGKPGNNEGEFRFPATIVVSKEDEVYVVDVLNTRAQVFDRTGEFLVTVGSWGVTQGQLFRPKGIALTKDNNILVSDSYLGVIQVYNSDTRFNAVLAADGKIARYTTPAGLAVDANNRVYIVESMANRVSVCQLPH